MRVVFLAVLAVSAVCSGAKIPSNWPVCKPNQPQFDECIKMAIQKIIPDLVKGQPKLGITTIDPLHFNSININQGSGPVSIDLRFNDLDVFGAKNTIIESVKNDWKTLILNISNPSIEAKGRYKINGKVLVLPITGNGNCSLKLDNFQGMLKFHIKEKKDGSKSHYHIEKMDLDIRCNPLRVRLDNLFNGNKQLGDYMNVFLNENWREIFNELKPAISSAFAEAFRQTGNRVFSRIPKSQITPS